MLAFESAAAIWGCDRWGGWPDTVHLIVDQVAGPTRSEGVKVHRGSTDRVVERNGFLVTDYRRTLLDLARVMPFAQSVIALDEALNRKRVGDHLAQQREALLDELAILSTSRGRAKAIQAVQFTDGQAANGGESYARVLMHALGFPPPALQTEHRNPRGGNYFTDFEWPEYRLIGELDGRGKYLKTEYLGRMSPGEAVVEEKIREDHLRAEGFRFARWTTDELHNPARFRPLLLGAGLPVRPLRTR
ncbi:hypothetical protein GCM10011399_18940 [Subtercola lobariae]|uniref:DUF559 domain-containing protein n=1 Tax=Subtercola lobariae TaxID=1588641 RepID=A0A917B7N1_9MICO|nr:hypothetical protein GCM10011399_18940 [Subtercola lobariae]